MYFKRKKYFFNAYKVKNTLNLTKGDKIVIYI